MEFESIFSRISRSFNHNLDQILPPQLQQAKSDIERYIHNSLQQSLKDMEFVTQDEFQAQVRLLKKTQQKLNNLEQEIAGLEQQVEKLSAKSSSDN